MKFGGIWSFIIGAQVAFTLLFVPAAVGIFTNTLHDQSKSAAFPSERYLTFNLRMDNEALAGERGVPDDGQIAARRATQVADLLKGAGLTTPQYKVEWKTRAETGDHSKRRVTVTVAP